MIEVTDSAADALRDLLASKDISPEDEGLRLFVEKGGCAGMSYAMKVGAAEPGDETVEKGGVRFYIDSGSREYLEGIRLDYIDALNDSGFKIENPNAARSCGCGTSFEPARADKAPEYDPATMDGEVCGGKD